MTLLAVLYPPTRGQRWVLAILNMLLLVGVALLTGMALGAWMVTGEWSLPDLRVGGPWPRSHPEGQLWELAVPHGSTAMSPSRVGLLAGMLGLVALPFYLFAGRGWARV